METLKIVKIGGNIIDNGAALKAFLQAFSKLEGQKILVHGGGKLASQLAKKMNIPVKMNEGRRITDADTLEIITMVYAGKINKTIVAQLQANQCNAIGFSGADGNTIIAKKRPVKSINYGFVGDIQRVNTEVIQTLLNGNITPCFCAISHNEKGQLLNTNADTISSELAIALSKHYNTELYYCFEKKGVLKNIEDEDSVVEKIDSESYKELKTIGIVSEGMIPKLDNCFYALKKGVQNIHIGQPSMLFETSNKHTTIEK